MSGPEVPDHGLLRVIGRGSYGEVWLARNIMGVLRAVKVVRLRDFGSERPLAREFAGVQHFEPVSRSHEGFVQILHIGRLAGEAGFFYVMELAEDAAGHAPVEPDAYVPRTLRSDLDRRGALPPEDVLRHALPLASALCCLHERGLTHRDVKPSNIIFVEGWPKLADVGLVSATSESRSMVGTEGFVPSDGRGTAAADVYALGKVLYETLTGLDRMEFPSVPAEWVDRPHALAMELMEIIYRACDPRAMRRAEPAAELRADLALLQSGRSVRKVRGLERGGGSRARPERTGGLRWRQRHGLARVACGVVFSRHLAVAHVAADDFPHVHARHRRPGRSVLGRRREAGSHGCRAAGAVHVLPEQPESGRHLRPAEHHGEGQRGVAGGGGGGRLRAELARAAGDGLPAPGTAAGAERAVDGSGWLHRGVFRAGGRWRDARVAGWRRRADPLADGHERDRALHRGGGADRLRARAARAVLLGLHPDHGPSLRIHGLRAVGVDVFHQSAGTKAQPTAVPNNDGVPNLLCYAFDLDPHASAPTLTEDGRTTGLPRASLGQFGSLQMHWICDSALTDLEVAAEFSTDGVNGMPRSSAPVIPQPVPGRELMVTTITANREAGFIRLRVSLK